ncbi:MULTISPECIES: TetR/AcrR family transcriptional regulator [Mycobacterium]|uniref:TetR family transcriptional regulator n=1 Tax=Mycobacterium persicum TaxID=1487726 RepID=A0A1X0L8M6_9MYCO|nr:MULTISPECIES: TetR/AcrR family transcriptional regulator [Mycobacterium]ARG57345.1 TetR family transcriptional regulator [Mycobacterium kansasii]KZS80642.1 TetR family transcriptional regulator [Mycobacterium persicum]ORB33151.1 TetR family transcriptional regulator [Mycobacterium persicum]ORB82337.1 TetR family transcriptional regulator [Mycobacterium persicum]ORB89692.1 TetR family transcriptional regulator [Mycobacterium persicum]
MEQKRPRNTTRLREAAAASRAETRRLLLEAAAEEFTRVGYVAATVNRIAERAGVTVQTLYLAWGSKRALLRGYLDSTLAPGTVPSAKHFSSQIHCDDPGGTLAQIAKLFCGVAQRSAIAWRAYRDGAAVDKAIAEEWQQLQALRRATFSELLATIPDDALQLPREDAVDTAWAIAGPASYELLVSGAGYSLQRFEVWVTTTLRNALLKPSALKVGA